MNNYTHTHTFSRRLYPKRLKSLYTHFTSTLTAHQEQLGVQCLAQGRFDSGNRTSNLLITKRLLYLLYHCRPLYHLALCKTFSLSLSRTERSEEHTSELQ